MRIIICSRSSIEHKVLPDNTAVISIADFGDDFAVLKSPPSALLQLSFNDVDNDIFIDELGDDIAEKYHMFTDAQAEQVVDFYRQLPPETEYIVCQCEHGQSRSAGIAAALLQHRCSKGIDIFANDKYYPNKVVYRKVMTAFLSN